AHPARAGRGFKKQVRINGVNKRSMDLVGTLRAVLFLPEDIKLVDGGPAERRRYLDIALCQIDRVYCRALSAYQKVLAQRNSLLRNLREQGASAQAPSTDGQLTFWDERLVQHGSLVVARRSNFLLKLEAFAARRHADLTEGRERFSLFYQPSFNPGHLAEPDFALLKNGRSDLPLPGGGVGEVTQGGVAEAFAAKLRNRRQRELASGGTLYGPHRDDIRFLTDGRDLRLFGSRGQQRTTALSLKLAEVQAMTEATGSTPLLLLDDVMSELDAQRRSTLLAALVEVDQVLITTTDWDDFTPEFRAQAQRFHVKLGSIQPV
ncbi:MAG: DNA replication and repair protein RecF, partial [Caldilineaceae bacterium]|nr:DNA replication and repair protein RecF [Caldilineaceae bacterium]